MEYARTFKGFVLTEQHERVANAFDFVRVVGVYSDYELAEEALTDREFDLQSQGMELQSSNQDESQWISRNGEWVRLQLNFTDVYWA